jgi:hypothetical protein
MEPRHEGFIKPPSGWSRTKGVLSTPTQSLGGKHAQLGVGNGVNQVFISPYSQGANLSTTPSNKHIEHSLNYGKGWGM